MSKRINVNPDHYKIAGRERPGDAVAKRPKQSATRSRRITESSPRTRPKK